MPPANSLRGLVHEGDLKNKFDMERYVPPCSSGYV